MAGPLRRRRLRREKRRAEAKQAAQSSAILDKLKSDGIEAVTKKIEAPIKPASKNIREIINDGIVEKQVVGDFEEKGSIRLSGEYPQNFVDVPKYNLSKIVVIEDEEVNFNFILCLKDGEESLPQLFATKDFYEVLIKNYNEGNPFGVNDIIEEKNIVVIDIAPIKARVEDLRIEEINLDINLTTSNEKKYVEVLRNLFVHSNYEKDLTKGLQANPTYTDIELLRYISWVVSKPAQSYNERLLPAEDLGDFKGIEEETPSENEPSKKVEETTVFDNRYPPIGREGVEDEEEAFYNNTTWVWLDDDKFWTTY